MHIAVAVDDASKADLKCETDVDWCL